MIVKQNQLQSMLLDLEVQAAVGKEEQKQPWEMTTQNTNATCNVNLKVDLFAIIS